MSCLIEAQRRGVCRVKHEEPSALGEKSLFKIQLNSQEACLLGTRILPGKQCRDGRRESQRQAPERQSYGSSPKEALPAYFNVVFWPGMFV